MTRRAETVALWVFFAVYLVILIWLVLFKLHVPFVGRDDMREIKLIPFAPTEGYGASSPFEVVGNAVVFIPFGIYLRALLTWRPWKLAAVVALTSLACEVMQFALALGSSDLTDVLVNTAGGVAGIVIVSRLRRRFADRTARILTVAAAIGTLIMVIAVGLHVSSFPRMPAGGTVIIA